MTLCAPLMIPRFAGRCASSGPPSCSLSLAFEGWSPLEAVSIDLEGRRVLELFPLPMAADAAPGGATPGGAAPSLGAALSTLPCHVVIEHLQSRQDLNGARARHGLRRRAGPLPRGRRRDVGDARAARGKRA